MNRPAHQIKALQASPLQEIFCPEITQAGVRVLVKRDDLLHPHFGGNKWRKLKYNIAHMQAHDYATLLTFGGAWSNHIYATAAAGKHFAIDTIGIIRGEAGRTPSNTLQFAKHCGMKLCFVDRQLYRRKAQPDVIRQLMEKCTHSIESTYVVPEGGSNSLGVTGCREIVDEISDQLDGDFDMLCCSTGTGATLAGLSIALAKNTGEHQTGQSAIGYCALKLPQGDSDGTEDADDISPSLHAEIARFIEQSASHVPASAGSKTCNWRLETDYHFGGYARVSPVLIDFIKRFFQEQGIMLDAVYTGKMFFALMEQIRQGQFARGSTIVAIHSGGLQGNRGFARYGL